MKTSKKSVIGYTYAAYHRGKNRHGPIEFELVFKRLARIKDTDTAPRVRNVYRHSRTHELYVIDKLGYFELAELA